MHIDEDYDWMDDFDTWEDLWACLQSDWDRVADVRQRLELERDLDGLVVIEVDRGLGARQRRELHRLGFRPFPAVRTTVWRWDIAAAIRAADPESVSQPLLSRHDSADPAARPPFSELVRTGLIRDELVRRQVQRVLQQVFRSALTDVTVVTCRDLEPWDEAEDEDDERWPLSSTLEQP